MNQGSSKGGPAPPPKKKIRTKTKEHIYIRTKKVCVSCGGVLEPPRPAQHTQHSPQLSLVLEATHKASLGPLMDAMSAQKALQGS